MVKSVQIYGMEWMGKIYKPRSNDLQRKLKISQMVRASTLREIKAM